MKKNSKTFLDAGNKAFTFDAMQLLSKEMYEIKGGTGGVPCTSCTSTCASCTSACSSTCATCTNFLG